MKRKHLNISGEEKKHHKRVINPKRSNFHVKTFSFNNKEISNNPRRREQVPKLWPRPRKSNFQVEDQDFQVENQRLKTEIESEDFKFVHL